MTELGEFLGSRSVNQSEIARKTGINKARINQLCNNENTRLAASEFYLILLAIGINPGEPLKELYGHLKLKPNDNPKKAKPGKSENSNTKDENPEGSIAEGSIAKENNVEDNNTESTISKDSIGEDNNIEENIPVDNNNEV